MLISVLEVAAAMVVSVMISVVAGTVVGTVESGWEMLMAMVDCGFGNNEWFDKEIITEIQRAQEHMVICILRSTGKCLLLRAIRLERSVFSKSPVIHFLHSSLMLLKLQRYLCRVSIQQPVHMIQLLLCTVATFNKFINSIF